MIREPTAASRIAKTQAEAPTADVGDLAEQPPADRAHQEPDPEDRQGREYPGGHHNVWDFGRSHTHYARRLLARALPVRPEHQVISLWTD